MQSRPWQQAARRRRAILLARRPDRPHNPGMDDRVQLLFGPYRPPRLRVGDRATCLLRDCEVIITSITDAPIPWPRCRALGGRGGSGPWLGGDLEEAVRRESAAAVRFWWRLSAATVRKMRTALGVTRTNNEGTQRLVWQAAVRGSEAIKDHEWTEAERAARRRLNAELRLDRNLRLGYHGPHWTKAELDLLGRLPDEALAARTGRTANGVRVMRTRLGIPTARDRRRRAAGRVQSPAP